MNRTTSRFWMSAVVAALALPGFGCGSDVGDGSCPPASTNGGASADSTLDSATIPGDDAPSGTVDAAEDTTLENTSSSGSSSSGGSSGGSSSGSSSSGSSSGGSSGGSSSGGSSSGGSSSSSSSSGGSSSSGSGSGSSSSSSSGGQDAGADATGDAAIADGTVHDGSTPTDTGVDSTVGADSGVDAHDTGVAETGGADGKAEGGGTLVPCTTPGQTGCVSCFANDKAPIADGTCTPTEALFVQHDIDKGFATVAGPDPGPEPTKSCYACLYSNTCIDDTHYGDTGRECTDSVITTPGATASDNATLCESVITCIFGSVTATTQSCAIANVADCYCGTAPVLGTCGGSNSAANGVCDTTIAAALGYPVADGTDNLAQFTTGTVAGGVANQIFNCAQGADCTKCLQ